MDRIVAKRKVLEFFAKLGVGYIETANRAEWQEWLEDGLQTAPFDGSLGVNWELVQVYAYSDPHWSGLIHELGHLVAVPQPPYRCDETEFLGWEMAVVQHLGLPLEEFYQVNADYGIYWPTEDGDFADTIGALTPEQREAVQAYYIQRSKYLGCVTSEGVPVAHPARVFQSITYWRD